MGREDICVSTKPLGIQHPYSYCVKPSNKMVSNEVTSGGLTMQNTGRVLGGLFNYVDYLTINANSATADECLDINGNGLIGNRYVLKTNIKCRRINENTGATISGDYYLHKYIDNATTLGGLITGGRPQPDVTGLIPSTFASAGKIGGNVMDIVSSFSGDTKPYCMKVNLQCHVIDSKKSANDYRGFSPGVYLSLDDIEDIHESLFIGGSKPNIPAVQEEFTNFIENIIYLNSDKIQNSRDFETVINQINFQDEFLVKTYYVGFSILIIILIFKLINKK